MSEFYLRIGSIDGLTKLMSPKQLAARQAAGFGDSDRLREEACVSHLLSLGLDNSLGWTKAAPKIDELVLLNLASVMLFLDHASKLEGLSGSVEGEKKTRFRHLPWFMDSIWLPVDFPDPKIPLIEDHGFPVFLGSCQNLLKNLEEIQSLSPLALGEVPPDA